MESSMKTQVKVGVFLLISLIVVLLSIFMIGGDKSLFTGRIRVHAHFDSVQGLAEGSVVSLSGVTIGNVEKINFIPDQNKLDVVMIIDKSFASRITEGSQVEIRTQGALGDKYIFVMPGDTKGKPIADGELIPVAESVDFLGMIAARGKETEKVFDIINELYRMTKSINGDGRLDRVMGNMAAASADLRAVTADARKVTAGLADINTAKLKDSVNRVDNIVSKIDRGEGTLGALINDRSLHEQLRSFLGASPRRQHLKNMLRTSVEKAEEP